MSNILLKVISFSTNIYLVWAFVEPFTCHWKGPVKLNRGLISFQWALSLRVHLGHLKIYDSLVLASGWNREFGKWSLPPHAKSRKAALPFPAAAREAAILMTCTDTKVDINKRRWMWTIRVTCLAAGLAGEQGKQVKKTQESYLYKLQGLGVCHYLLENFILTWSFFWFPSVSSFTRI